jgi:hypothetical protein
MPSAFRQRYEESLREGKPTLYRWLLENGELSSHLDEVSQAADQEFDTVLALLRLQSPEPTSYREKAQRLETLASQARELVMDALLIRDDHPIPDGYPNHFKTA